MLSSLLGRSRVQRVRHELRRRTLRVIRRETPSPGFVCLTFADASLHDFRSDGFDDHVKLLLPQPDGSLVKRDYTPRAFDTVAGTLTIEFALHAHGPASDWARQADVGTVAEIGGPRGSMLIPAADDWQLLIGDASALPAILRRLEELPAGRRVQAFVRLDDAADARAVSSPADARVHWLHDDAALLAALRAHGKPAGSHFVWAAGEHRLMAQVRELLAGELGIDSADLKVSSYWKRGVSDFNEH